MAAFDDVRNNPWLLDYCFAWLAKDDLTKQEYGDKAVDEAKEWFLNTDIPVALGYRVDAVKVPMIAITIDDTSEGASTLGDIHYEPTEKVESKSLQLKTPPVLGPFTPKAYNSTTGIVTLPDDLDTSTLFSGMILFDAQQTRGYEIAEVLDASTFTIAAGVKANFIKAVVTSASSLVVVSLESVEERESYRLDLVLGEPKQLIWLYTIVKFCLYRYKQSLLEARGFDRSVVSNAGVRLMPGKAEAEIWFTRAFTLSGYVRQYWPKAVTNQLDGFVTFIKYESDLASPDAIKNDVIGQGWGMDRDPFDGLSQP